MGSRTWIKIYCDRWLNGSIREETPEVRGIWVDLLVLAGSGKYGDSGEIKITDRLGYFDKQLAELLQISVQKWVACKKKLIQTERVCVENNNIIVIKNWSKYQSEYERQRVQRQETPKPEVEAENVTKGAVESASKGASRERDKRIEKETIEREGSVSLLNVFEVYKKEIMGCPDESVSIPEDIENDIELTIKRFTAARVRDAIREGVKHKRRDWRYIVGILKNWEKKDQLEKTRGSMDPDKYIKGRYGHMVRR